MKKIITITGLVILVAGLLIADPLNLGGVRERDCDMTESIVSVGNQEATTVLTASGNRAWGVIKQPINATNTATVAFDGSAAVAGNGFELTEATSTSPVSQTPYFGLNADLPYTSSVSVITNSGSTTVKVLECTY